MAVDTICLSNDVRAWGCPNIIGNVGGLYFASDNGTTDGAFKVMNVSAPSGTGTLVPGVCQSQFDAKRYEDTYGRSTTVQSSALQTLIIIKF